MKSAIIILLLCGLIAMAVAFLGERGGELLLGGWLSLMTALILFVFYAINGRPAS